jgi:hypothetical protein
MRQLMKGLLLVTAFASSLFALLLDMITVASHLVENVLTSCIAISLFSISLIRLHNGAFRARWNIVTLGILIVDAWVLSDASFRLAYTLFRR